jgi:uncharacterized protein YggE
MEIGREYSMVSVYGVGMLKIKPTIVKINISLSHTSTTILESQTEVNKAVNQLLKIFNEENISNDPIFKQIH